MSARHERAEGRPGARMLINFAVLIASLCGLCLFNSGHGLFPVDSGVGLFGWGLSLFWENREP